MGTRSITTVRHCQQGEVFDHAHIYRHWDGYPGGHGQWLYEFLKGVTVGNGKPLDAGPDFVNGPGRLAARLVAKLYEDGHEPDLLGEHKICGQEYEYIVTVVDWSKIEIEVYSGPMTFFGGGGDKCVTLAFKGDIEEYGKFIASHFDEDPFAEEDGV